MSITKKKAEEENIINSWCSGTRGIVKIHY